MMPYKKSHGFTLIEVLLALSVLAIALTALLKASTNNIIGTQRVEEKTFANMVAMQGLSLIQLHLVPLSLGQEITKQMVFEGQTWYWHATLTRTSIKSVQKITITTSLRKDGGFRDPLIGFQAPTP
jgi:general secretion pathway protein I